MPSASNPDPSPKKPKPSKLGLKIPPILLEGDEPKPAALSGQGQRYALGPDLPAPHFPDQPAELPNTYGTQHLMLVPRDPHWLYAHWDLAEEIQRRYNDQSIHRHLILRIFACEPQGQPLSEVHVHSESRQWFIPVQHAGSPYVAVLGFYQAENSWVTVATSNQACTPVDSVSEDPTVRFATMPPPVQDPGPTYPAARPQREPAWFEETRATGPEQSWVASDSTPARSEIWPSLPAQREPQPEVPFSPVGMDWTPEKERALAEVTSSWSMNRDWVNSLDLLELSQRAAIPFGELLPALFAETISSPVNPAAEDISSPLGGEQSRPSQFWFNVNAELIIYGATDPGATVTIGGRRINLRPDGTFSYRFALPDGTYDLPIIARSIEEDHRHAALQFTRATQYQGEVGVHPQDEALKTPRVENVV